jgi:quinol monooxygenase YgiN
MNLYGTKCETIIASGSIFEAAREKTFLIYTDAWFFCFREKRTLMIILKIAVSALPEKQKEVTQTLLSMIEPTAKEKGCLKYEAFSDIEDKNAFSLLEMWESREDLETHLGSDRFGVLLGTKSLLSEPLKIQIYTVSHSEEMEVVKAARVKKSNAFGATSAGSSMI